MLVFVCVYTCVYSFMRSTVTRIWDEYENYLWNQTRLDLITKLNLLTYLWNYANKIYIFFYAVRSDAETFAKVALEVGTELNQVKHSLENVEQKSKRTIERLTEQVDQANTEISELNSAVNERNND